MESAQSALSRRSLLVSSLTGAAIPALLGDPWQVVGAQAADGSTRVAPPDLKKRIRGPIVSIPTTFTRDDAVHHEGVRTIIKRGLAQGIVAYELTAGDSQYHALSFQEIKELTRVMVEAVGDKGIAIAATGAWWTSRAIDYVRFAESVGAHGVQVLKPAGGDDGVVEHYRKIADSTRLGIILHGNFPLPLLERIVKIDSVVGMKEDVTEKYMFDIARKFGRRLAIFGGGQKWRFLVGQPYGLTGYLSTFGTFAPKIAVQFWETIERKDMDAARQMVLKYDQPMFDFLLAQPPSFHACWRATLEYFGVAERYLRKPEASCTDEDMAKIKAFWSGLGLTP